MPGLKKLASTFHLGKKYDAVVPVPELPHQHGMLKRANAKLRKRNKTVLDLNAVPNERVDLSVNGRPAFSKRFMQSFVSSRDSSRVDSFEAEGPVEEFGEEARAAAGLRMQNIERRPPLLVERRPVPAGDGSMVSRLGLQVNAQALQAKANLQRDDGDGSMVSKLGLQVNSQALRARANPQRDDGDAALNSVCPLGLPLDSASNQESKHNKATVRSRRASFVTNPYEEAVIQRRAWDATIHGELPENALAFPDSPELAAGGSPRDRTPAIRDLDWNKLDDEIIKLIATAYDAVNPLIESHERMFLEGQPGSGSGSSPVDSVLSGVQSPGYEGKGKARASNDGPSLDELEHAVWQWRTQEEFVKAAVQHMRRLAEDCGMSSKDVYDQIVGDAEAVVEHFIRTKREVEDRWQAELLQEQLEKEREAEARLAAERAHLRDCNVCGDSKDPFEFAAKPPTAKCAHPATTCNECLESWMASEFKGKGADGIKCPECPETMDYADVQRAASAETFEAFDKLAMRLALGNLEDFAWCLAPSCDNGQLNSENRNYMHCQSCGYKQCLKHKVPWHTNETCEQYDYRTSGQRARDEDRQTEAMLDGISKKCPGKNCGWRIEKTDGCDHMTCKKCKWEFCWQCLASQKEIKRVGNTAHAIMCKFHSTNLDVAWPFNVH